MKAGTLEIELITNLARITSECQQINRTFGDLGAHAERIAKGIAGAFGAALGAISFAEIIKAAEESERISNRLDGVIKAVGSSAGYTRKQIDELADSLAVLSQFDDESFKQAAGNILRFGEISGQQFERTLKASADLAAFMGTDVPHASETLAKALASPTQGVERLQRTIGYLDKAQIDAIRTMVEMGDSAGAQDAILETLEKRIGGVAEAMNTGYTKAFGDAKKATNEFFEALGSARPVQATTESFLGFVSDSFKDLKAIVEGGDWFEKALRLLAFAGGMRGVGNPEPSSGGDPSARLKAQAEADAKFSESIKEGIKKQDLELIAWQIAQQKKRAAERFRLSVDSAEAELKSEEMFAADYADAWKWADYYRNQEAVAAQKDRETAAQAEQDANEMFAKDYAEAWKFANKFIADEEKKREAEVMRTWGAVADFAGDFFSDLVMNGREAFDSLRQSVKKLLADMLALFAKRWILQMAGATGAASYGSESLAGTALNAVGSGVMGGSSGSGGGIGGMFASGAGLAGIYEVLSMIPIVGWIAIAVLAAYQLLAGKTGGDKFGGSFFQGGAVPGTDNGRFFTPNQGDSMVHDMVIAASAGFVDMLGKLGGTGKFNFGLGFDHDQQGSAQSRVSALVTDASGNTIYNRRDMGMDDKDVPGALQLESQRMILAALQHSDLPEEVAGILNSIVAETATSEQINAVITAAREMKAVIDALGTMEWGNLSIDALKAMAAEGETIAQTFQRIAGSMAAFDSAFLSDAQKLDVANRHVKKVFDDLGIAVPKSTQELIDLVHGLDLSTEAGRRFYDMIMSIFPDLQLTFQPATGAVNDLNTAVTDTGKRAAIAAAQLQNSLADQKKSLGDFLNGLLMDPALSSLSLQERLALAKKTYEDSVGGRGNLNTAGGVAAAQEAFKQYLTIAHQVMSGPDYTAILQGGYQTLSRTATGERSFGEAFNASAPRGGERMASGADLERHAARVERAFAGVGAMLEKGLGSKVEDSGRKIVDAIDKNEFMGG